MAKLSWKAPTLLATILLVALGLQASAVKILLNLSRQPEPAVAARESSAAPSESVVPPISVALEAERWPAIDPPPNGGDPAILTDPPHLADLAAEAQSPGSPPATDIPPVDPVPTPAPNATATAMARLAALAEPATPESAPVPPAPVAPEPALAEPATSEPVPVSPAPVAGLQDADWLKARNPRRYTIQLFSGKDLDKLKEVAAALASDQPQAYYTTGSRTSPWYSLVMGDYPDAATARTAAANLAASSALKPWVRRFDDIQSSIR